jgi:hypothetical protein
MEISSPSTVILVSPGEKATPLRLNALIKNDVKSALMAYTSEDDIEAIEAWEKALSDAGIKLKLFVSAFVSPPEFAPYVCVQTPVYKDASLCRAYERFTVQQNMFSQAQNVVAVWNGKNSHRIGTVADAMRVAIRRGLSLCVVS